MRRFNLASVCIYSLLLAACSSPVSIKSQIDEDAPIWPDYKGVTVPSNIAPLNFCLASEGQAALIVDGSHTIRSGKDGVFRFKKSLWRNLMAQKDSVTFQLAIKKDGSWSSYRSFSIYVSKDAIDPYVSYRLIPPGYQGWKHMGLYQRDLESYSQSAILENRLTGENCMNCHIPAGRNPERAVFHSRADFGGTVVTDGTSIEKLNTKTDSTVSALVYPFWHPGNQHIAFSVNKTMQSFYAHAGDRIEVFDNESDVVVYNTQTHKIFWSGLTRSSEMYETFPAFSPDGKWLYFCSCKAVEKMPRDHDKALYGIYRIAFDASSESFGSELECVVDTPSEGLSASFPRISPDGRFLAYTRHCYGNFSIWHKDSDIRIVDLQTGTELSAQAMNSPEVDSYHSWSSNSRWMIFSSRRDDGLYTKLYICHIGPDGSISKPFLMPQENPVAYYRDLMFSYNVPELMTGRVKASPHALSEELRHSAGTNVGVK